MTNLYIKFLITLFFSLTFPLTFYTQIEDDIALENELETKKSKKDDIKKGWKFKGLPVISYDTDLGLQLGALGNAYDYGDGSRYPVYNHSLYLEASWFLKGSGIFRFNYDSDRLIKGIRTSFDVSYLPDRLFKFFGFNGYEAVYNQAWENDENPAYKSRAFYRYHRKFFRTKLDFQGNIIAPKFRWLAGVDFYSININPVDIDHLNKGKPDDKLLPDTIGLYQQYIDWGIIAPEEADGGMLTAFKLGLVYDSRDNEPNPNRGIWTEIILVSAPKITSNMDRGFSKLAITHRQYFTFIKDRLTFAYRLGLQANLGGHTPYYATGLMFYSKMVGAYNEGLGGAKTIRGVQRNRVIGNGIVFGNFELRWKVVKFLLFHQDSYVALSGFFDTGRVIQKLDIEDIVKQGNLVYPEGESEEDYFNFGTEKFHNAAGAGLHLAWGPNFIIAVDYGRALDKQDGESGLYVGLNFLF